MIFPYLKVILFLTIIRKFLNAKTIFSDANMYFFPKLEKTSDWSKVSVANRCRLFTPYVMIAVDWDLRWTGTIILGS
jgi:hypothetical protein